MVSRGKKYREIAQKIDRSKKYDLKEAIQLALEGAYVKFDETIDIAVRLGVDPGKARWTTSSRNSGGPQIPADFLYRPPGSLYMCRRSRQPLL